MIYKTFNIKAVAIQRDLKEESVPCGDCIACCVHLSPILTPDEFANGKYIYTLISSEDRFKPTIAIPRDENGCIYLENNKCKIYNDRPLACRQFDCRKGHYYKFKDLVKTKFNIDLDNLDDNIDT